MLAAAIQQGIDPDNTYYTSAPFTCTTGPWCASDYEAGKPWTVHTYSNTYAGSISITNATLQSDNTVYAQLTLDVGPQNVAKMAEKLGIDLTGQKIVASIGLGSLLVSPLEMAAAYATFADGGVYAKPTAIRKVILPNGKVDTDAGWGKPQTKRVLSQGVAWKVTQILGENALYGTGAGSGDGTHPNAGKTGTTSNYADAWFDGFTRDYSSVVWMGYPRGEIPMLDVHGETVAGATFPVPIWHLYMEAAEAGKPARQFQTPASYPVYKPFTKGYWGYLAVPVAPTPTSTSTDHGRRQHEVLDHRDHPAGAEPGLAVPPGPLMLDVSELLSIGEALGLVLARVQPLEAETVALDAAAGRVLAEPAIAVVDLPSFPASAMDGFALRARDVPATLPIVARIAAGRPASEELEGGQAMAIATGGVVPAGADAVVPIEDVEERDGAVVVPGDVLEGANVRPRGGDLGAGDVVVQAGTRLGPVQLGALAAGGVTDVRCARRPHVVLAVTGTELRSPGEPLGPGEIYDANGSILSAQIRSTGATVDRLPPVDRRRRGDARRDRARPGSRHADDERRRLGRRLRPRARDRGGARRRRGLLAGLRPPGQADRVRRPRPDARLRPSRQPGLVARRLRALRATGAARVAGPCRAAAVLPARPPRIDRAGSSLATLCCARGRGWRMARWWSSR